MPVELLIVLRLVLCTQPRSNQFRIRVHNANIRSSSNVMKM
jgi:hypothetical protein